MQTTQCVVWVSSGDEIIGTLPSPAHAILPSLCLLAVPLQPDQPWEATDFLIRKGHFFWPGTLFREEKLVMLLMPLLGGELPPHPLWLCGGSGPFIKPFLKNTHFTTLAPANLEILHLSFKCCSQLWSSSHTQYWSPQSLPLLDHTAFLSMSQERRERLLRTLQSPL